MPPRQEISDKLLVSTQLYGIRRYTSWAVFFFQNDNLRNFPAKTHCFYSSYFINCVCHVYQKLSAAFILRDLIPFCVKINLLLQIKELFPFRFEYQNEYIAIWELKRNAFLLFKTEYCRSVKWLNFLRTRMCNLGFLQVSFRMQYWSVVPPLIWPEISSTCVCNASVRQLPQE